ncbi:hypothetical protein Ahy_A08g039883 [Arachis hypogaea]|uniref:Replication protein A 70 kDa DNA-binding subunit B/D first OB fold domain-containing protein n=1 Tax=Arachis hypogaea TaxID=3818 RepID=A0A445BXL2_ARAHY|nr:hypothetical protein Ahy_A08g039883 [Arachis hypogaea]
MAGIHKIADINPTIDNLCVRIRVIRLWTLPSYENSPLSYSIEMVWLDEDGGKIHASVKKVFVSRFVNLLEEGISYQIRYFGVGLNKGYFKTTYHEYVVNLNQRTDVHRLPESSSIPRHGFKFVSFDTLNAPGYDCTYLVDVVGYLAGIENEKTLEKNGKSTKYTVIELEIDDGKIMECALFGNYVHELNTFLGSDCKDGAVVVLQFVRVKLFNEKIVLQNFMYGIKIFFNLEDTTVIQFKNSFVRFEESRGNIGGISNEAAFLKIYQGKTIEQLKEFDTSYYGYSRLVVRPICGRLLLSITPRYRIKLGVIDNSDCACFVVFDKEAKQVLGKSCVEILDPLLLKGDLSDTPTLLLNLIDKTFLFIIEVQISDNPHFSPSYKVKKMIDNVDLINKFKEAHPIQIDVDYTGGLLPISKTSSIIEGEKVEGAKNLLLEFSNEVAANDESELLENAITPTKRLSSKSEESKVEGDTSTSKKIKIEKET